MNKLSDWKETKKRLIHHKVLVKPFELYGFQFLFCITPTIMSLINFEWLAAGGFLALTIFWSWAMWKLNKARKKSYEKEKTFLVVEEGLQSENEKFKGIQKWACFNKAIEDDDAVLLFQEEYRLPILLDKDIYEDDSLEIIRKNILKYKRVDFSLRFDR